MKKYLKFINESVSPYQDKVKNGILDLSYEGLTKLETLPEGLKVLYCYNNKLKSLPELPDLTHLSCSVNQLTSLPELPDSLQELYCHNNQLTSLPELPEGLIKLWCFNNPLETLIPKKFWNQQDKDWLNKYMNKMKSFEFQEYLINNNKIDVIQDLYKEDLIHTKIKELYQDKFDIIDWGLV